MHSNNSNGSRAAWARGFVALWAMLAMGLGLMARPAEAAPFAYVTSGGSTSSGVYVIDTAKHPPSVVATVTVGSYAGSVAVTPDGKHVYVANLGTNLGSNTVSVIRTATNTVVATVALPVGSYPDGVAVTPDGKHVYVATEAGNVSVIATATKTVVATIPVGMRPSGVAITPDGTRAYVTNFTSNNVSVIDTTSNTVEATVPFPAGSGPNGIAITPDGKHAYVTNYGSDTVSVIDTTSNTVEATVPNPAGSGPSTIAITPDGKHAYVANRGSLQISANVSVIDTATNMVVATVTVEGGTAGVAVTPDGKHAYVGTNGSFAIAFVSVIRTATNTVVATVPEVPLSNVSGVGIVPPPPGVPFLAFSATALDIAFGTAPNEDFFNLHSQFTLSSTPPGLHPHRDPVTLQVGTFSITIPPHSFTEQPDGSFAFAGVINGVSLKARITPTATLQYAFHAKATSASLTFTTNPVYVTLIIGGDSGATSVNANISPKGGQARMDQ